MRDAGSHGVRDALRVGFVGLGRMGAPMARRIAAAGLPLAVHDVRREVTAALVDETGVVACARLAELAARSDLVVTMLPDGATVRQVVTGEGDALLGGLAAGALVVDMSSCAPGETQALGAQLRAHGVALVDAPVSGGVARAVAGTLAVIAGGAAEDVARCRPLFAAVGTEVFHAGPLGSGHAVKALNNAVSAAGLLAAAEALLVGQRFGVEPGTMVAALNASSGRNNATENKLAQFVLSRTFASGFELELLRKDLRIAAAMAREANVPAELVTQSLDEVEHAAAALEPGADHTAVVRWLEQRAGVALDASAAIEEVAR